MHNISTPTETLTNTQYKCITKLREHFKKELNEFPEFNTRWCLMKFCIARNFDHPKVELMLRNMFEWRRKMDFQSIFDRDHSEYEEIAKIYASGFYNVDKVGRPIMIERLGATNMGELLKDKYTKLREDYFIQRVERQLYIQFPMASEHSKAPIDKIFMIMDLKGINSGMMFSSKFKNFLKYLAKFSQDFYPEMLGKMFIVNAPTVIKVIWSMVRMWIDKKTADKIEIHNNLPIKKLAEYIDLDNLPDFLGGTSKVPLSENPGPWKTETDLAIQNKSRFMADRRLEFKYFYVESDMELRYQALATNNFDKTLLEKYLGFSSHVTGKQSKIFKSRIITTKSGTYNLDDMETDVQDKEIDIRLLKPLLSVSGGRF